MALLALGMVMLYSSSMAQVGARYLLMQLVWGALGLVLCVVVAALDYRLLKPAALPILLFSIFLLALVLVPIPDFCLRINGARRWFNLGFARFQPSELAKLGIIIALACYMDGKGRRMREFGRGLIVPGVMVGTVLTLIFMEPDRGTTILLAAVCGTMLLLGGVRLVYVAPVVVSGAIFIIYSVLNDPVRSKRIAGWLNPEENKSGVGYQAYQAMLALGAGGWSGLGLGNGRQKLGFVPEHHTDFIFSIIGEELGVVATLLVILAYILILLCGLLIAARARDAFGMLLASGISFLIGLQAFINIGVVTSALPNKGLPLPFISYGGSNLLMMLICVGVLLSIARQARPDQSLVDEPDGDEMAGTRIA